jgi:hypothetical protein
MSYFKINEVCIKIIKEYEQENTAGMCFLISDWVGDLNKIAANNRVYNMGIDKKFILIGHMLNSKKLKISKEQFNISLDKELHNYKEQLKSDDIFDIHFKRTESRVKKLKKYCIET